MEGWHIIERNGYGSHFNDIAINQSKSLLKKIPKNNYGKNKLKNEIAFYQFVQDHNVGIYIPNIYEISEEYFEKIKIFLL